MADAFSAAQSLVHCHKEQDAVYDEGLQGSRKVGEQLGGQSNCLFPCYFASDP